MTEKCKNITYESVYEVLSHWIHPFRENSTMITCCDYYEGGEIYKYSYCDNDIGVVVPEIGSAPYTIFPTQNSLGINITQLMNQIYGQEC